MFDSASLRQGELMALVPYSSPPPESPAANPSAALDGNPASLQDPAAPAQALSVLLIANDPATARRVRRLLARSPASLFVLQQEAAATTNGNAPPPDVILFD